MADLDELLTRADRARDEAQPTQAELMCELECALDGLDQLSEPRDAFERLHYQVLRLRVSRLSWLLEDGSYAPRPVLHLVRG